MGAVLLDPTTGRPESAGPLLGPSGAPAVLEDNARRGWQIRGLNTDPDGVLAQLSRAPARVLDLLERARSEAGQRDILRHNRGQLAFEARASMQSWEELIYATIADGAQVLNTTTETIMVPDFTLPANYLYPGRALKYTILGDVSTVITTPGTITAALRYGGVAGTALATSGAFAPDPTAASTNQTCMFEFFTVARAAGSSAASFTIGRAVWGDYDDASATTIVGNLNMTMIPATGPAAVNINTTAANALSPTIKFSVSTATTQFTAHIALLEALS